MKRMKRIMALMLAAIMMMAMSVTAFAAGGATGTHTLTVNVKSTEPAQDLKGQTINTHRLLVRGERIPYEEATKQEPDTNIKPELSFTAKVLIVTIIVIFIGLMIAIIYSIRDRQRRKVR